MATNTRRAVAPVLTGNALEMSKLLLWARQNGFVVHGITVGDVTITCTDRAGVAQPKGAAPPSPAKPDGPANIYEEFGGKAWAAAQEATEGEPGEGDDDEE